MTATIAWIHADNLNPNQPALAENVPAIFVWDDDLLAEWDISFKRVVFIYECLLELPVTIRRGNVAREVAAFASEHNATRILTPYSPSPRHRTICHEIQMHTRGIHPEILHEPPFVNTDGHMDLKRFSRYWRKIEKFAMRPTNE